MARAKGTSKSKRRGSGWPLFAPWKAARGRGRAARPALSEKGRERVREIASLLLLAMVAFITVACLNAGSGHNPCGPAGEALAQFLLGTFGHASWLLVVCLALWGVALFTRAETPSLSVRGSGLLLCLVSLSALLAHLFGHVGGRWPAGGLLGEYINTQLIEVGGLGVIGTRIALVALTLITFVLATDILYYAALASGARWVLDARERWREQREAVAEERAAQARTAAKAAPAAPRVRVPVVDEDEFEQDLEDELDDFEEEEEEEEEEEPEEEGEEDEEDVEQPQPVAPAAVPRVREPARSEDALPLFPEGDFVPLGRGEQTEYVFPSEDLLEDQQSVDQQELDALLAEKTVILESTLTSFKIEARCVEIQKGPVISMFEMELGPGIKVERLRSLEDDLAIALRARTVRIVAPIPGKNTIGIEVPNPLRETVRLKPLLHCKEFNDEKTALPVFLGRDAAGRPMVVDLAKMPHLLVAGATGSGKSVCLNAIICSLLFTRTPEQVKLVLLDPKMVELSQFSRTPHLACPVVSDMKRAPGILEWAVTKMEERYRLLAKAGVRNIYSYNKLGVDKLRERFGETVDEPDFPRFLPFIVMIVDELADLMMTAAKDVETSITRLAAKSRAVGIHIILATQRPSTNVITGLIKANLPTRVAFMVSSKIDSRVILDVNGAEQLLGEGDMLFLPPHTSHVVRGQCTYISEEEVRDVMASVGIEASPHYEPELVQRKAEIVSDPTTVDDLYDAATRFIIETQRGSASLLQRKFAIGYTRASRLIDLMAEEGVLGEYKGSQAREVGMTLDDWIALNPEARGAAEEEVETA